MKKYKLYILLGILLELIVIGLIIFLLWDKIEYRLSFFSIKPLCNLKEERALHIGNFVFPLCFRCMFIFIFFIFSFLIFINKKIKLDKRILIVSLIILIPMIIDGSIQTFFSIESTNVRRSITGSLFGLGLGYILYYLYTFISNKMHLS